MTLTGPAGVGKSRLVTAVYDDVVGDFADGGCFVDLSDAVDTAGVVAALATAVGIRTAEPTLDDLVCHVRDRELLVVLDHCERASEAVSSVAAALVATCARLRVLVVNGEPLHLYGEWLVRLGPLETPSAAMARGCTELGQVASVRLFVDRAAAVREGFALTPDNETAIAELCDRLDGLPLALELAAARMKLFTARAILAEVERGLDILQTTRAGTSSRHQTMRDAIASGCGRLSDDERTLFARLAVFGSAFSIEGARLVAGPVEPTVVELLETLVDKNLLVLRDQVDGELTFGMLNTTRSYALELLTRGGDLDQARRGHADHFYRLVTGRCARSRERRESWLRRLVAAHTDVHAALEHLVEGGDAERAAVMAVALRPYWLSRGLLRDGLGWLDRVLVMAGLPRRLVADVLRAKGELATWLDGDACEAEAYLDEAASIYESSGDLRGVAACQRELGMFLLLRGEAARAEKLLVESIDGFTDAGDHVQAAYARVRLATLYCETARYAASREALDAARGSLRCAGDDRALVLTGLLAAILAAANQDNDEAERVCRETVRDLEDLGERFALVPVVEMLAVLLTRHQRSTACWRKATLLLGGAAALREDIGHRTVPALATRVCSVVADARDRLGEDAFDEVWAAGRAMSTAALVAEALAPVSAEPQLSLIRTTDAAHPLTARELEVAELVSAGLTNRQIARRLGIAEWTVVNHLRKIMRKLDCSSRVEVARWLTRQRVVDPGVVTVAGAADVIGVAGSGVAHA